MAYACPAVPQVNIVCETARADLSSGSLTGHVVVSHLDLTSAPAWCLLATLDATVGVSGGSQIDVSAELLSLQEARGATEVQIGQTQTQTVYADDTGALSTTGMLDVGRGKYTITGLVSIPDDEDYVIGGGSAHLTVTATPVYIPGSF